jgi:uncharacterized protein
MAHVAAGLMGCFRCAYVWRPSGAGVPRICPRCKSRFWDVPLLHPVRIGGGLGILELLSPHREAVLRAAHRWGFRHVRVFGSVRRSAARRASDIDLLVDRDAHTSLFDRAGLTRDLEGILGHRVDVVPEESLHWLVRAQVLFEAVPL